MRPRDIPDVSITILTPSKVSVSLSEFVSKVVADAEPETAVNRARKLANTLMQVDNFNTVVAEKNQHPLVFGLQHLSASLAEKNHLTAAQKGEILWGFLVEHTATLAQNLPAENIYQVTALLAAHLSTAASQFVANIFQSMPKGKLLATRDYLTEKAATDSNDNMRTHSKQFSQLVEQHIRNTVESHAKSTQDIMQFISPRDQKRPAPLSVDSGSQPVSPQGRTARTPPSGPKYVPPKQELDLNNQANLKVIEEVSVPKPEKVKLDQVEVDHSPSARSKQGGTPKAVPTPTHMQYRQVTEDPTRSARTPVRNAVDAPSQENSKEHKRKNP